MPFHASALTITEDTACRYEVSAKKMSFHLQLLCWCMYFTPLNCIIEPLEKLWQSLITRSTCPLPRIIAWQRVSQSPHSNPSSSSPPDLTVRRSNAILGPHAIGMSSHASYTPSPFTLHSITPAQSWSPSTCQIMERAASPERSTAAIYRIPTSRHPSTYPPYLHTIQCHHHAGL